MEMFVSIAAFEEFDWRSAPASSIHVPLTSGVIYVFVVISLHLLMRGRPGLSLRLVQACHNLTLSIFSLGLALGTAIEVARRSSREGALWLLCEDPSTKPTGALWFMSYVYYLSKYWELLDTVLQLLKGRPPPHFFLNVYHHAIVLLMAWGWVEYVQSLSFVGLLFNTSVHVVMYYYYFCRVLGWPVWWKRYVTQFQIVQFATSALCYAATLCLLAAGSECAGCRAMAFNFIFNMTLLFQFVGVMRESRRADKTA
uniref:Elongation of fatty acids protein n=1 Tax=Calcidiscus leptoporus TaxID=127549 RepID=A0A7S0P5Y2_9EUKA|mmetsp:Transcript_7522/g.17559  ORF Transcript_7522/g.17559 Transcript_7522/m.17559 type:complete len:255 (+) Transcript_7522:40-804(+)